ncbi:hypothetical protein DH2020_013734 [Rehmannia glutinosa]|uniref:Homeobox-leucine zipper protein n=1 Tax=Rehmannia glutinosa TaxID=99300 RepID=A0ABR0X6T8_REHGL
MDLSYGGSGSGEEENYNSQKGKKNYHQPKAAIEQELGLDQKQIKFWFQNKRTQIKAQNEKADNNALRTENERIHFENLAMQEALKNIICPACNGSSLGEEDKRRNLLRLRMENARLKEEHERTINFFANYMGNPAMPLPGMDPLTNIPGNHFLGEAMGTPTVDLEQIPRYSENPISPHRSNGITEMDKSIIIETAVGAMNELVDLLRVNEPVWVKAPTDGRYILHRDSYDKLFPKPNHIKTSSARFESSKDSGEVAMAAMHLIEMLLDVNKWKDMFPTIVTKANTIEVLDTGILGGLLHLMYEKVHVLSPLVAPREFFFIRYCRQLSSSTWVMVDVSYDFIKQLQDPTPTRSWKLPSGCMIEDMSNGKSTVSSTESHLFELHEFVIESIEGQRNLMKLSHRMVKNFCEALSMSDKLDFPHLSDFENSGVRVSFRKSNEPGQLDGFIVSAATSIWLPMSKENLFDFLKDEKRRVQWDVLSSGNPVNAVARISTGTHPGNCLSIIQPFVPKESKMLMLQEGSIDPLSALLIYAPMDLQAIISVVNGEDPMRIPILPSGYVISSDGRTNKGTGAASTSSNTSNSTGSLLTVAFQILVCRSALTKELNMESVATVHTLVSSTILKIKAALDCSD